MSVVLTVLKLSACHDICASDSAGFSHWQCAQ